MVVTLGDLNEHLSPNTQNHTDNCTFGNSFKNVDVNTKFKPPRHSINTTHTVIMKKAANDKDPDPFLMSLTVV